MVLVFLKNVFLKREKQVFLLIYQIPCINWILCALPKHFSHEMKRKFVFMIIFEMCVFKKELLSLNMWSFLESLWFRKQFLINQQGAVAFFWTKHGVCQRVERNINTKRDVLMINGLSNRICSVVTLLCKTSMLGSFISLVPSHRTVAVRIKVLRNVLTQNTLERSIVSKMTVLLLLFWCCLLFL